MNKNNEQICPCCERSLRLARATVPMQQMQTLFRPEQALVNGTVFPELHMIYKEETQ